MKLTLLVLLCLSASVFGIPDPLASWNSLHATWTLNPLKGFDLLPRQQTEKHDFGFVEDLCEGNTFRGRRYMSKGDSAIFLLFDKNGIIAGIQTSVKKTDFTPTMKKGFVEEKYYWTQTAYFVDPDTICTKGRTKADLDRDGTGTGLWIQTGPDPSKDLVTFPLSEKEIKNTKWGPKGKCLPTMGAHYWHNVSLGMDCDDFFPNCLLYNHGQLTAFCFAINGVVESPRYDNPHPTNDKVGGFIDPVPKCFFSDKTFFKLTTLHIYFHSNPRLTSNC